MCYGRKRTVQLNKIIMKQFFFITITLITFFSCKAQTFPLYDTPNDFDVDNGYYKDLDGDLTKLIGTWQYTNGNESLKLIIKKKEQDTVNARNILYKEDVLYGEYLYIDSNGTEIVNTLSLIDTFSNIYQHSLYGNYIISKNHLPSCNDCLENERRVEVSIEDPLRSYFNYEMIIRHIPAQSGNPEQIKIQIKLSDMSIVPEGQPDDDRIPTHQEIILTKQ
ncbi:DUF6705 family protein [Oceanihabitans sediminis]|uniref:DUF6705 family protein n=1 Tax=Oceanihabitans sediminis TaxID=1812012 RepID=UPI00299EDE2F|nr:DUF6705 family protein [Oceanihabitans sediminis]MDX1772926.1 DUF6705 family protein [Oceanihabitans sediminis]